jgi:hypothetical protein
VDSCEVCGSIAYYRRGQKSSRCVKCEEVERSIFTYLQYKPGRQFVLSAIERLKQETGIDMLKDLEGGHGTAAQDHPKPESCTSEVAG